MHQRLENIFKTDGKGKNRRWTFSQVIERLKAIRSQTLKVGSTIIDRVINKPDDEQKELLDALNVKM